MPRPQAWYSRPHPTYQPFAQRSTPLVSAAPDLFAVARLVEQWVAEGNQCPVCLHRQHAIDCQLIDAIAKAEGR
jgi:hypothetical protein